MLDCDHNDQIVRVGNPLSDGKYDKILGTRAYFEQLYDAAMQEATAAEFVSKYHEVATLSESQIAEMQDNDPGRIMISYNCFPSTDTDDEHVPCRYFLHRFMNKGTFERMKEFKDRIYFGHIDALRRPGVSAIPLVDFEDVVVDTVKQGMYKLNLMPLINATIIEGMLYSDLDIELPVSDTLDLTGVGDPCYEGVGEGNTEEEECFLEDYNDIENINRSVAYDYSSHQEGYLEAMEGYTLRVKAITGSEAGWVENAIKLRQIKELFELRAENRNKMSN